MNLLYCSLVSELFNRLTAASKFKLSVVSMII